MKCLIFLIFPLIIYSNLVAQTDSQNLSKYWFYRNRLKTKFLAAGQNDICEKIISGTTVKNVVAGSNNGYSIPLGSIDFNFSENNSITDYHYHWVDEPQHLGWYIGVLATEYKLLANAGLATDATLTELYYAMQAFEALDQSAEALYYPSTSSSQYSCAANGFLTRSNVSAQFFNNTLLPNVSQTGKTYSMESEFVANNYFAGPNDLGSRYMSPDHVTYLLLGFALVKKYFGSETSSINSSFKFKDKAIEYADRMITYIKNNSWRFAIPNTNPTEYTQEDGILVNMNYGQYYADILSKLPNFASIPLKTAGTLVGLDENSNVTLSQSQLVSYFMANAAQWITDKNYMNSPGNKNVNFSKPILNSLQTYNASAIASTLPNKFANAILQTLAAVGDGWYIGLVGEQSETFNVCVPGLYCHTCYNSDLGLEYPCCDAICNNVNFGIYCYYFDGEQGLMDYYVQNLVGKLGSFASAPVELDIEIASFAKALGINPKLCFPASVNFNAPDFKISSTAHALNQNWANNTEQYIYPLLYDCLHSDESIVAVLTDKITSSQYKIMIDNAPCLGITSQGNTSLSWNSENRWITTSDATKYGSTLKEYNGLDFMLLYNMYQIQYGGSKYPGMNEMDLLFSNVTIPTTAYPAKTYNSFNSIATDGTVTISSGTTSFVGGKSIELNSGFSVSDGATFEASVKTDDWNCISNSYSRIESSATTIDSSKTIASKVVTMPTKIDSLQAKANTSQAKRGGYTSLTDYLENRKNGKPTQIVALENANFQKPKSQISKEIKVGVFPNPSSQYINIEIYNNDTRAEDLEILNLIGNKFETDNKLIEQSDSKVIFKCSVENLPTGIYFISIKSKSTVIEKIKFLKY